MSLVLNRPSRLLIFCVVLLCVSLSAWGFDPAVVIENRTYLPADGVVFEVAELTVTSGVNVVVDSGADVTFVAGQSVTLGPGFTVKQGASFTAAIGEMNGEVVTQNESWSGSHYIDGDVVVQGAGTILDLEAGTTVLFLSDGSFQIGSGAELVATGCRFTTSSQTPGSWQGIVVNGTLTLYECTVEAARQGVRIDAGSIAQIVRTTLTDNLIGIHIIDFAVLPAVTQSTFVRNLWYGIKEDIDVQPGEEATVVESDFIDNGRSYYDTTQAAMDADGLNTLAGSWGNSEQ